MSLRPYQKLALDAIRAHFGAGQRKVLLHLATGGGKTHVFCQVLKGVSDKKKSALMVVRGRKLIEQASKRLDREGVDHGIIMANHWRQRPNLPIQIASIDTLYARRHKMDLPPADLIVIDEAHFAVSNSFMWLVDKYKSAFYLAVTATPHVKLGLRHVADEVVYPITMAELMEQGFLVKPEYYAPSRPVLDKVSIDKKTGDYKLDELCMAMQNSILYGDMINSYKKYAEGLSTLVFCVKVSHSKQVRDTFLATGIKAEHLDATMSEDKRNAILARLESGETKVVCNVSILTTGVDLPYLGCIMLARPTKSYNLYIQIVGRGTRPFPGKDKFIVLDHANCVREHGFIERERRCQLDGKPAKEPEPALVSCEKCAHIWDPVEQWRELHPEATTKVGRDYICQGIINGIVCGWDNIPEQQGGGAAQIPAVDVEYELKKIESIDDHDEAVLLSHIRYLIHQALARNSQKPEGRVYHQIKDNPRYGRRIANRYWYRIKSMALEAKQTTLYDDDKEEEWED